MKNWANILKTRIKDVHCEYQKNKEIQIGYKKERKGFRKGHPGRTLLDVMGQFDFLYFPFYGI